jgi:hypothetical protein
MTEYHFEIKVDDKWHSSQAMTFKDCKLFESHFHRLGIKARIVKIQTVRRIVEPPY